MRAILACVCGLVLTACVVDADRNQTASHILENGLWYDGEEFIPATVYVVDGELIYADEGIAGTNVLDLADGYVIPPLCEAHNHNLGNTADETEIDDTINAYLYHGVFYALMQGSFDLYRDQIADDINHPKSVDVAFANNGVTGSGGHPRRLRELLMERFDAYPEFTVETLPDAGYFEADTLQELQQKWALILAEQPDLVKAMLLYSEEFELRKNEPAYYGSRGLNPALLPELVRLANEAGLRVSVHVETDADMAAALHAGAHIIAHLPSHDADLRISEETIALAVESDAALVTTLFGADRLRARDPELYAATLEAQRDNLSRLSEAGANLVLGSDYVHGVSVEEAEHLASLGALDNQTILKMWTENCARTVFPNRRIGRVTDGFEASFLVLDENPIVDLEAVATIRMRFKDGEVLELQNTPISAD